MTLEKGGFRGPDRLAGVLFLAAFAFLALGAWFESATAHAAFPGENGRIAFTKSSDVWVMNPDGSEKTRLTCDGGAEGPTWSPDGERIATSGISVIDADGRNRTLVGGGVSPVWSPTGERIASVIPGTRATEGEVHVSNADGSGPSRPVWFFAVNLTRQVGGGVPAWSADGVIALTRGFPSDIWTMDPDSGDETQLTDTPHTDEGPLWSPDGERIAFVRSVRSRANADLWLMSADGSAERRLTVGIGRGVSSYVWSPDGNQIAFIRPVGPDAAREIWVMNADGTEPRRLDSDANNGASLDWQPLPAGASLGPPPSQFCFGPVRWNTNRGVARLIVEVPRPGRVVLQQRPGVRRFAQAHREAGSGRVVLRVRPRGRARHRLGHRTKRLPVRAQVTYRPWVGEPLTKGRRVWLVQG
jgi:dipeptidyl aminopeptidase/acylaminoacyl peptidase